MFKNALSYPAADIGEAMSTRKQVTIAGVLALVLAVAVVGAASFTGLGPIGPQATPQASNAAGNSQSTLGGQTPTGQGTLALMVTDPPNVPEGVTKVYVNYSDLAVHAVGGNWTTVQSSGTVELMGTVNVAQTLSSAQLSNGTYNLVRFNISSAQVTYNGKNYTAFVQGAQLTLPIVNAIQVTNGRVSAAVIDITPTVINIGSTSTPEFVIKPVAHVFPMPQSEVNEKVLLRGYREMLTGKGWWDDLVQKYSANLQITSASLTGSSLSVTVKDSGQQPDDIQVITVSPLASTLSGDLEHMPPGMFFGSAVFVLEHNGTVVTLEKYLQTSPPSGGPREVLIQLLGNMGYNLTAGASQTLTYTGEIPLGYGLPSTLPVHPTTSNSTTGVSVVAGQQYLITVVGEQALASTVVVAG